MSIPNSLSRRSVLAGLSVLPFVSGPVHAAVPVQRIMVQGRPQDTASPYKLGNIMPALDQLGGVRKMRCREPFSGTAGWSTYVGLARQGVQFCFTLSVRPINTTLADLRAFLKAAPRSIFAIEFPNEPDLNPVSYKGRTDARLAFRSGAAVVLMAFIRDFHAAIRSDPVLSSIPLIASNDFMQKEQGPYTEFANSHIYPGYATNVSDRLAGFEGKIRASGNSAGIITEWGRTTGGGPSNATASPVSLADQGRLLASDVAAALKRPAIHTISLYELFSWRGTSEMTNFGLFNNDLSPRPAVAALRSLLG